MGLLDWLTDLGSTVGMQSPEATTMQPPAMPPVQQTGADGPPLQPQPQGAQQPFPVNGTTPFQPSPPVMQPPQAPPQSDIPPNAAPTSFSPQAAGDIYKNYQAAGGGQPIGGNPGPGRGFLGQAFGMNSADEKNMLGSLGAGLKSVGDNWNKPGLAAFAGSAGSAIEGGTKAEKDRVDEMLKLVQAKQKAGDVSTATSLAQVRLQTAQLQLQSLKEGNGKGAWNKPPTQLYQDAARLADNNSEVKGALEAYKQALKNGAPDEIATAKTAHAALHAAVLDKHLTRMGLPPESAEAIAKTPGITAANPVPQAAFNGKSFDQVIKPNADHDQYFMDEKGQMRVLRATKKTEAGKAPLAAMASIPSDPADAADQEQE